MCIISHRVDTMQTEQGAELKYMYSQNTSMVDQPPILKYTGRSLLLNFCLLAELFKILEEVQSHSFMIKPDAHLPDGNQKQNFTLYIHNSTLCDFGVYLKALPS